MILEPASIDYLRREMAACHVDGRPISGVNLSRVNALVEFNPEDMTATVQAGMRLEEFQKQLRSRGQWLPLDPPGETVTVGEIIAGNLSGPRRHGFGVVADYLIGMQVMLADGTVIKSGGKVVKNVAGFDLAKLFLGSGLSLGIVLEATFKLRPVPEREEIVSAPLATLAEAGERLERVILSELSPMVLDLHHGVSPASSKEYFLVLGFAGFAEEVQDQLGKLGAFGDFSHGALAYDALFRTGTGLPVHRLSVLPSELINAIRPFEPGPWVARAGNGILFHRGPAPPATLGAPAHLVQRLKKTYDPKNILPS